MTAYYNEHDPKAAAWLRELIKAGLIMDGVVDERSIADVSPDDVMGFQRCHFFAGLAGWDYALQLAGWPDDRPVWTGSCPCQPFSAAGKRKGTADERHLWPEFARLIAACKPATVFGEQVASKDGRSWLAGVFAGLEGMGYQRAGADLCAAGVGAPHIRQRLFWVADSRRGGDERLLRPSEAYRASSTPQREAQQRERGGIDAGSSSSTNWLPDPNGGIARDRDLQRGRELGLQPEVCGDVHGLEHSTGDGRQSRWPESERRSAARGCCSMCCGAIGGTGPLCQSCRMGDTIIARLQERISDRGVQCQAMGEQQRQAVVSSGDDSWDEQARVSAASRQGFWSNFDFIPCGDGKTRRIECGTEPLVDGLPRGVVPSCDISESYARNAAEARVMRLKGYGNSIVPQVAAEFIAAFMECEQCQ